MRCTDFGIIPTPGISVCYVSACEYLVYARLRFLCYYFGADASGDDLVKDLAALFLAEQFYGVLEQLRRKLLDNGGGIGIENSSLTVRFLKSIAILLFVIAGSCHAEAYIIASIPQNGKRLTDRLSFKRTVGYVEHNVGHREGRAGMDVAKLDIGSAAAVGLFRDKDLTRDEL